VKREEVFEFFRRLAEANPSPTTELESTNPYQLLVAVVLSAQATDASVNIATKPLFEKISTPRQMVEFGEDRLREAIKTIGLFNTKAKNVIGLSQALIDLHGGEVPRTRGELQSLPGVGRKTANVVLNTAFGEETFAVDTHVFRVCNRTGLAPGKTPDEVEAKLDKIVPQPFCRYKPKTPAPGAKPNAARTSSRASSTARTVRGRTASTRSAGRSRSRPGRLP
jgi:endonuclease III